MTSIAPGPAPASHDEADGDDRPLVVAYRSILMNYNEVYLRTEVEALRRYRGFYVGAHRVREVELPHERTFTLRERFQTVDRRLDPVLTRAGRVLSRIGPAAGLGRHLAGGSVVGRASETAFKLTGRSPTLVRAMRRLRPSLIHAYTGVSAAHALPLARRLGVPLVATFGGYDATATEAELWRHRKRGRVLVRRREALKRELAQLITISDFLYDRLLAAGWPAERLVKLRRGIDTALFTPDGAPPLETRRPVVFHAGRLIEVKGTAYLLRAMRRVQARLPLAELVVAGAGALRRPLEEEAAALGVRVRWLGRATPETIRACHREARVYCMPSVLAATGQREGLSNALLEAMASGLPVVASRCGGIPEAVGDTGILVPERDERALAEALLAVLEDPARGARMGREGRRRVLAEFDLRTQAARLEALYDEVLARHAVARPRAGR